MSKIFNYIEKQNLPTLLFIILSIFFLNTNLEGGEYQYFTYAKQFMDKNWIPESFSINEFAGTRIFYQIIIGTILKVLSFELTSFFFKVIIFINFGIVLSKIFKKLTLTNTESIILVTLFLIGKQSFIGYEWIFGGIEPKTFAYLFLFWALHFLLNSKYHLAYLFIAFSTYFHLMVGGWFFIMVSAYLLYEHKKLFPLKSSLYFILPVLPFVIYLLTGLINDSANQVSADVSANWIYVYYRLPHHLGIFRDMPFFIRKQLGGVIYSILILTFTILIYKKKQGKLNLLQIILSLILIENLVFVGVAAFDKYILSESGGLFLKFYPFRMSSLAKLLFMIVLFDYLKTLKFIKKNYSLILKIASSVVFLLLSNNLYLNIKKSTEKQKEHVSYYDMTSFINKNTLKSDKFLLLDLPEYGLENNSFIMCAERESIIIPKFTPAMNSKLIEWHQRIQDVKLLKGNPLNIIDFQNKYDFEYIVSLHELCHETTALIYSNQKYYLYMFKKDTE